MRTQSAAPAATIISATSHSDKGSGLGQAVVGTLLMTIGCEHLVGDPARDDRSHSRTHPWGRRRTGAWPVRPRGIPIGDDDLLEVRDSVKPDIGTFVLPIAPSSVDVSPGDVTLNFDGTGRREVGKLIFGDLVGVNHEEGVSI